MFSSLKSTFFQLLPPSVERNTPRSALDAYRCPIAATNTTFGFFGSTAMRPMCCVSSSPMCDQLLPASVDLYMPLPYPIESRSVHSPVPTYTVSGADGATAIAPIDATGCESNTGVHTRPASTDFHTPPFTAPE